MVLQPQKKWIVNIYSSKVKMQIQSFFNLLAKRQCSDSLLALGWRIQGIGARRRSTEENNWGYITIYWCYHWIAFPYYWWALIFE